MNRLLSHEIRTENGNGPRSSTDIARIEQRRRQRHAIGLRRSPHQHEHVLPLLTMELPLSQNVRLVMETLPDLIFLFCVLSIASHLLLPGDSHGDTLNEIRTARRELDLTLERSTEIYHEVLTSL